MDKDQEQEVIKPLTKADCPEMSQLQIDVVNVMEGRIGIMTFPSEYRQQIQDFYRFSPVNSQSSNTSASHAARTFLK